MYLRFGGRDSDPVSRVPHGMELLLHKPLSVSVIWLLAVAAGAGHAQNRVLQLDGEGDYVQLPSGALRNLDEATVELWVKWGCFRVLFPALGLWFRPDVERDVSDQQRILEFSAILRLRSTPTRLREQAVRCRVTTLMPMTLTGTGARSRVTAALTRPRPVTLTISSSAARLLT